MPKKFFSLLVCSLLSISPHIHAEVIGAAHFPHGGIMWDCIQVNCEHGTLELNQTSTELGKLVSSWRPDLIVLTTPHGVPFSISDYLVWSNSQFTGYVGTSTGRRTTSTFSSPQLAAEMVTYLRGTLAGQNVTLRATTSDVMRWAEVIPLLYLEEDVLPTAQTIIINQPDRGDSCKCPNRGGLNYDDAAAMLPEALALGGQLYQFLDRLPQRVVFVVSSDWGHTHDINGPYGFSPRASLVDGLLADWIETLDRNLLSQAAEHLTEVRVDGFIGCAMLHGFMEQSPFIWESKLYSYFAPTYFGMAVGAFEPIKDL